MPTARGIRRATTAFKKSVRKGQKLATVSTVKKLIGKVVESKYKYTSTNATLAVGNTETAATPMVGVALTNIAQGDDTNGRDGNHVKALYLRGRFWTFLRNQNFNSIRFLLIQDKECSSATATPLDEIIQDFSFGDENTIVSKAVIPDKKKRFKILYDKVVHLDKDGQTSTSRDVYKKLGFTINYNGTANTNLAENQIFLYAVSAYGDAGGATYDEVGYSFEFAYKP